MDKYDDKANVMAQRIGSFLVGESVNDVVRLTPSVAKKIAQALRESYAEGYNTAMREMEVSLGKQKAG